MAYAPHRAKLATPIGPIVIEGSADALTGITILPEDSTADDVIAAENGAVAEAVQQISAYFDGSLRQFDLPLTPSANPRGEYLRAAIAAIPYGETLTYGQLAQLHGSGARAVGSACARNPFPIVIPCHRVTSSGGARENYSAGRGPVTKAWLNAHEARNYGKALL